MLHFGSIDALAKASEEEILAVRDMGEISARAIVQYFRDPASQKILESFRASGVNFTLENTGLVDEKLAGKTFVITGTLPSLSRKDAAALIESHGGRIAGSVSKKTDYLVAGEAAGSKLQKATALGIAILDEAGLMALVAVGHLIRDCLQLYSFDSIHIALDFLSNLCYSKDCKDYRNPYSLLSCWA